LYKNFEIAKDRKKPQHLTLSKKQATKSISFFEDLITNLKTL